MAGVRGTDLPEPSWWKRARQLNKDGFNYVEIAKIVGKSDNAVRNIFYNAEIKARQKLYRVQNRKPDKRKRVERDNKRMHQRLEARVQWRDEGRIKPLESYYRKLECL
jgi:hypothetical protein